jgi:carboxypeptidase PM20D1
MDFPSPRKPPFSFAFGFLLGLGAWLSICLSSPANGQTSLSRDFHLVDYFEMMGKPLTDTLSLPAQVLSAYLQIPSPSKSEKEAGRFMKNLAAGLGLHTKIFSRSDSTYSFAASLYPLDDCKPNILLLNHLDVVPAGDINSWRYPPYGGTIAHGAVWGRGAIDMKGPAVAQLLAIAAFVQEARHHDLPYNVTFLCVSGEEEGGTLGAGLISENFLAELNAEVVLGEGGSGLQEVVYSQPQKPVFLISTAEKHSLWLKLSIGQSTSGHGSVPPLEYANKSMISVLEVLMTDKPKIQFNPTTRTMFRKIGRMEKGMRGVVLRHNSVFRPFLVSAIRKDPVLLSLVTNTITLTGIENPGGAYNQIPQQVSAYLDCRLLPETDPKEFIRHLRKKIRKEGVEISVLENSIQAKGSRPGRYFRLLEKSILEIHPDAGVVPYLFPASSDNNYFRHQGITTYGVMPMRLTMGQLESIHNYNEHLPISELESAIQIYTLFLQKVLGNEDPEEIHFLEMATPLQTGY